MEERTNDRDEPIATSDDAFGPWLRRNGPFLLVLAIIIGFAAYKGWSIGTMALVVFGLGLVIFVHELGHFLAAKWCDVYVETFSIGFGPSLPFCQYHVGETTYKIGVIPLGGYVKMLGEGSEGDEQEEDPRSFKNKSVGQRMLIISAGVIMNLIFAAIGFMCIYMGPGRHRIAGVVGTVDPGSRAWEGGLRSGAEFRRIGKRIDPYFDQIKPTVALSGAGEKLPVVYSLADGKEPIETVLEPKFHGKGVGLKLIGIGYPTTTTMRGGVTETSPPCAPLSAASKAEPALKQGDTIVATTDPANPSGPLLPLPVDPRCPTNPKNLDPDRRDVTEMYRRFVDLAGQPMQIQLKADKSGETREVTVPPAFAREYGMVMRMGPITSVRQQSAAAKAGVQAQTTTGTVGDVIERVEVKTATGIVRFTNAKSQTVTPGVEERPLDPMRLPMELDRWAITAPDKTVKLGMLHQSGRAERTKVEMELAWDPNWRYARELPPSQHAPMPLSGLGIAYQVEAVIDDVIKDSPAARVGLKPNDEITAVRIYKDAELKDSELASLVATDKRSLEWPYIFSLIHNGCNPARIDLVVKQSDTKKSMEFSLADVPEDKSWPWVNRGFHFTIDTRHQVAESPWQAIVMGAQDEVDTMINVYLSLLRMVEGEISFLDNANGPIAIAAASYNVAAESVSSFVYLLCLLSVNLAVLNFLPIPVLDGGHMVFLLYEKLIGRPASELVRTSATFAGMALLLSFMACVIVLDVMRVFFKS